MLFNPRLGQGIVVCLDDTACGECGAADCVYIAKRIFFNRFDKAVGKRFSNLFFGNMFKNTKKGPKLTLEAAFPECVI